ncbi:DUF4421 family protein [Muriicola sp.]|uniref:DUF4421 family protein n=1 Tax=Muriicola sp. TaxID=2020856 RepID=UPI003C710234
MSVGFAPTFFSANQEDDIKGKSSLSDFRFRAALGQWVQGIQISSIEGYYVENTGEFLANWTEGIDPFLQLPDLKYQKWGMSTSYVLNPNFSFRNVLYQTEWQKKSAGSIVPTLFYSYDRISYTFEDISRAEKDIFPIRLSLAYYYTLVVKENWFIGASLSPSAGIRFSKLKLTVNDLQTSENNVRFTNTLGGVATWPCFPKDNFWDDL